MDWITRALAIVSPTRAASRLRSQVALKMMGEEIRRFEGAGRGRRFGKWGSDSSSQNQQIASSLHLLKERSRDMERNNGYSKNAIRYIGNNVVGTGIMATPVSLTGNKVDEDKVKAIWKAWSNGLDCDFDGLQNFYGIQKMIMKTAAKSGSCLVRKVWKKYKKGKISLELQVLDPDFLDRSRTGVEFDNGEYMFHGIQYDKNCKRKAYWLYDRHPLDFKVESKAVPADDIIHFFYVEDPGQVDGLPFNSSVLLSTRDFDEYVDAQLMKQKVAACFAGFITTDADGLGINTDAANSEPGIDRIQPGIMQKLARGESVTFSNPPTTEGFGEFARQSLLGQAAGMGLSFAGYTGDLSQVNFSSGRMGWLAEHRNFEDLQWNCMIPMFCDRVWGWFIKAAYLSGLIDDANMGVTWTPPRREMIDPVKETKALSEMVRNGFMSWQDAVRSLGYSPEEILAEMKKDAKAFDESGLMPTSDPRYDDNRINDAITPTSAGAIKPVIVKKPKTKKVK